MLTGSGEEGGEQERGQQVSGSGGGEGCAQLSKKGYVTMPLSVALKYRGIILWLQRAVLEGRRGRGRREEGGAL